MLISMNNCVSNYSNLSKYKNNFKYSFKQNFNNDDIFIKNEKGNDGATIIIPDSEEDFWNFQWGKTSANRVVRTKTKDEEYALNPNKKLEEVYGIKSTIKDTKTAKRLLEAVEDFCKINENNNLFKNSNGYKLIVNAEYLGDDNVMYKEDLDEKTKEYNYTYNSNYNIDKGYNLGLHSSTNPKYLEYLGLSNFLSISLSPQMYNKHKTYIACGYDEGMDSTLKIGKSYPLALNQFKGEYITAKMCGVPLPKALDNYFITTTRITDLKFPKCNEVEKEQLQSNLSQQEIESLLKKKYGINASFGNKEHAIACLNAVDILTKSANNKYLFKGLRIQVSYPSNKKLNNDDFAIYYNKNIYINPLAANINIADVTQESYNEGLLASNKGTNLFIHELAHYLNDDEDKRNLSPLGKDFNINGVFDNQLKVVAGKVSEYAVTNTDEFCSEYISGRMDGRKYGILIDDMFKKFWNGPKLKFPPADK